MLLFTANLSFVLQKPCVPPFTDFLFQLSWALCNLPSSFYIRLLNTKFNIVCFLIFIALLCFVTVIQYVYYLIWRLTNMKRLISLALVCFMFIMNISSCVFAVADELTAAHNRRVAFDSTKSHELNEQQCHNKNRARYRKAA